MQLPMNRVRQIIQMDSESAKKTISKEALVMITKAAEIFCMDLAGVCAQIAKL